MTTSSDRHLASPHKLLLVLLLSHASNPTNR